MRTSEFGSGSSHCVMEQFVLLAKKAHGAAARELVEQAVAMPGLYVFAELLACPNISELAVNAEMKAHYDLISLFAYGTYDDFIERRASLPALSDAMHLKLRQLTIVSLATQSRCIPYQLLLDRLRLSNIRELEDVVIDAVYKGVIQGKLDPLNQQLEVESWRGRDVPPEQIAQMSHVLNDWTSRCQAVLCNLEEQVERANKNKAEAVAEEEQIEAEVANIKKTIKINATGRSSTPDLDEPPSEVVSSTRLAPIDDRKKRLKGLRGSSAKSRFFAAN